jgi:hypothetical protein
MIGFGTVTAAGGVALGAKGTRSIVTAQGRIGEASARHGEERAAFENHWRETNDKLIVLGNCQARAFELVVGRMADFLRRNEKLVNEAGRLLVDGIEPIQRQLTIESTLGQEPRAWINGIFASTRTGIGLNKGLRVGAKDYAKASTGTPISKLSGAAEKNALNAFFGGGSKAAGGAGKVVGQRALVAATVGPAVLVSGLLVMMQGEKAKTGARAYESSVNIEIGEMAQMRARFDAIGIRAAEIEHVLDKLVDRATAALDLLESEPFTVHREVPFRQAMSLAIAVRDVAMAQVINGPGDLDDEITQLKLKYRPLIKETTDD